MAVLADAMVFGPADMLSTAADMASTATASTEAITTLRINLDMEPSPCGP
jgi:hypothetical protein